MRPICCSALMAPLPVSTSPDLQALPVWGNPSRTCCDVVCTHGPPPPCMKPGCIRHRNRWDGGPIVCSRARQLRAIAKFILCECTYSLVMNDGLERAWLGWQRLARSMAGKRTFQLPAALAEAGMGLWQRGLLVAVQPLLRGRIPVGGIPIPVGRIRIPRISSMDGLRRGSRIWPLDGVWRSRAARVS